MEGLMKRIWITILAVLLGMPLFAAILPFRADFSIDGVDSIDEGVWRLSGAIYDNSASGFSSLDAEVGDYVFVSVPLFGDLDVYHITDIIDQTASNITCDVEYLQDGEPRIGQPIGGIATIGRPDPERRNVFTPDPIFSDSTESTRNDLQSTIRGLMVIPMSPHTHDWVEVTNTPTTLDGYGITNKIAELDKSNTFDMGTTQIVDQINISTIKLGTNIPISTWISPFTVNDILDYVELVGGSGVTIETNSHILTISAENNGATNIQGGAEYAYDFPSRTLTINTNNVLDTGATNIQSGITNSYNPNTRTLTWNAGDAAKSWYQYPQEDLVFMVKDEITNHYGLDSQGKFVIINQEGEPNETIRYPLDEIDDILYNNNWLTNEVDPVWSAISNTVMMGLNTGATNIQGGASDGYNPNTRTLTWNTNIIDILTIDDIQNTMPLGTNSHNILIGKDLRTTGMGIADPEHTVNIGDNNDVNSFGVAVGSDLYATNASVAIGLRSKAGADSSVAIGYNITNNTPNSTRIQGVLDMAGEAITNCPTIDNIPTGLSSNDVNTLIANKTTYSESVNFIKMGTGAQGDKSSVAIGPGANSTTYGVALGSNADGSSRGVAAGTSALGSSYGAAFGTAANGGNNGCAMGYKAIGTNNGVAIGRKANGANFGVSLGTDSVGKDYSVAMGNTAKGYLSGVAIGRNSLGTNDAVAIGPYAAAFNGAVAIGYRITNTVANSTRIFGQLNMANQKIINEPAIDNIHATPGWAAYANTTRSFANANVTTYPFNTISQTKKVSYNVSTYVVTPQVAGWYMITASVAIDGAATAVGNNLIMQINRNGEAIGSGCGGQSETIAASTSSVIKYMNGSTIAYADGSSTTFQVVVFNGYGRAVTNIASANITFNGRWIGY